MFGKIGAVLVSLGVMSADSESIWIPFAIVMAGFLFVVIGEWRAAK